MPKGVFLLLLLAIFVGCTQTADPTPEPETAVVDGLTLILGDISDEPAETINGTQPTANYLAAQLSEYGITDSEVKIAPDLETMIQWMQAGEVDLYFDSPYPVLVISRAPGAGGVARA